MKLIALILSILLMLQTGAKQEKPEPADLILKNGRIYTVDEKTPTAEAVAVKYGKIVFVGSNVDVKQYDGKGTKVIDLKGLTVVPGLTDAHCHLAGIGEREMMLNLEGSTGLDDFLVRVKARVDKTKPGEWIIGAGWIEREWKPQVFPTRSDLDKISPNNPVYLTRADHHSAVVNSAALKIAHIDKDTKSPEGGEILKDKQTGEPTGMLIDRAMLLFATHRPSLGGASFEQALTIGANRSVEAGWTQIQDAGAGWQQVDALKKLFGEQKIKLRVYQAIRGPGGDADKLLKQGPILGLYDQHLTVRAIKVSVDGALGSRGAKLLAPYSDQNTVGLSMFTEDDLLPMLRSALKRGIQMEIHAIGDGGNREVLDLYEKALDQVPSIERYNREDPRWRIEHAQIVDPNDIPRFAKMNIIPSMQPSHAIGDLHFAGARLGKQRLEGAYAWQSMIKAGSIVPGGSDAPVERGEPMIEFYAAVARKDLKGFSNDEWHPEQKLTREQALKMFTIWPAFASFEEKSRGSITVGKMADFTVLSADIMQIPEADILKTKNMMTIIGGEVAYQADTSKKKSAAK